ncbi:Prkg1, partial [Symbiodinium sp. CCMP2592]
DAPFHARCTRQIHAKVLVGINKVTFPPPCKGAAEDLVRSLCKEDPSERLPMKEGGVANLKKHTFFKGFDWQAFEKQSLEPPYKPQVKNKKDIGNFHALKDDLPPQVPYKDDGSGWDKDFATSTFDDPEEQEAGHDLMTLTLLTPSGLQVTPLGNAPLPVRVPIVNPAHVSTHQFT